MAWKISKKDYYIRLERTTDGYYHDYHSKEFRVAKKYVGDTVYSFYHNHSGMPTLFLDKIPFADIIDGSTNLPFASVTAWEDWYQLNTGQWGSLTQVTQQIEYASALTSFCDVSGNIVAFGTIKFDENTGLETAVYYNASLQSIASLPVGATPCHHKELDLVIDEWLPICKNGVQYFRQLQYIVDNNTGLVQSTTAVWKDKTDAIIPAITAPFEIGYCADVNSEIETPHWFVGDNGPFLGSAIYASNVIVGWDIVNGDAPSSPNAVGHTEYGYSFTSRSVAGQTLEDFIIANDPNGFFRNNKVLSISILNEDLVSDLVFDVRGFSKTVLKAGQLRSMTWGEGQSYPILSKFFGELTFQSEADITINFEQVEI